MQKIISFKWIRTLYGQVVIAVILGITFGVVQPHVAEQFKILGDLFLRLIKMWIPPLIFCTIVMGIASAGNLSAVGKVGLKALVYFEVMSTFALVLGLIIVNVVKPGSEMNVKLESLSTKGIPTSSDHSSLSIIPENALDSLVKGNMLQVIFLAIVVGIALAPSSPTNEKLRAGVEYITHLLFAMLGMVMKFAPLGAFGAMAFTVGKYGFASLRPLAMLIICFYTTSLLFVFVILGLLCASLKFSVFQLLAYLKEEFLLVLGTSSSESALPNLMKKLEKAGCDQRIVRLVVPTGYSFNLDGTSIYLTMAAVFVANALKIDLSWKDQLSLLLVLLLTSKGAATVTGGGFVTLSSTLESVGTVPVAGLSLLLGVDRFMSEARALTNMAGNAVATVVISKWEGAFDAERYHRVVTNRSIDESSVDSEISEGDNAKDVQAHPLV